MATGLTTVWATLSALAAWQLLPPRLELAAEVARNGAWLALLLYILRLRMPTGAALPSPLRLITALSGILVIGLLLASLYPLIAPTQPVLARWVGNLGLVMMTVTRPGAGRAGLPQHPP